MTHKELTDKQAKEIKEDLQSLIKDIKGEDRERKNEAFQCLINYKYSDNGHDIIDLENFISKKIHDTKAELNLPGKYFLKETSKNDKPLNQEILEKHPEGVLYERIISHFNFPEVNGNYKKWIYSTINYIGESIKSGMKNYMRDEFNINENEIKNIDFEEDNNYTESGQIKQSFLMKLDDIYQNPEYQLITRETIDTIWQCIYSLPEKQEEAITKYIQGYNQTEISEQMGNSQQAVSRLINKAREKLDKMLKERGIYYLDEDR